MYRFDITTIDEQENPYPDNFYFDEIGYENHRTFPIGTKFWQIYHGSRNQVSKIWEVDAYLGSGIYSCKLISDNTVISINPDYRENFNEDQINKIFKDNPIV